MTWTLTIKLGLIARFWLVLRPPEPGIYEFTCEIPGHEDMKGTLVVR